MDNHNCLSASYARILFRHLRLGERNGRAFFNNTGINYESLMTLDGMISRDDFIQIYRNVKALSGREDMGLSAGKQLHLSTHGPLGVAVFSGPDLRCALTLLAKYSRTRMDLIYFTVSELADGMTIQLRENGDLNELRAFMTEAVFSSLFSAIYHFIGEDEFNGKVSFSYSRPNYWEQYRDHFGLNLVFGHTATEIFVPEALLSRPSPVADPTMHNQSLAICEQQLKAISDGSEAQDNQSIATLISTLMFENPGRIWSLTEIADRLNMSPRTLIRKLEAEGTKFQAVRDKVAKDQVARYLADDSLTVESIGHLMGFSDVSSFRRSFKRWFGETPSQYVARTR